MCRVGRQGPRLFLFLFFYGFISDRIMRVFPIPPSALAQLRPGARLVHCPGTALGFIRFNISVSSRNQTRNPIYPTSLGKMGLESIDAYKYR